MATLPPYEPPRRQSDRAIHLARMVLPQNPKPVPPAARLRLDVTDIEVPGTLDGPQPLVRAALALPEGPPRRRVLAEGPGGLAVPWSHHPGLPALALPGPVVEELVWQDRWRTGAFVSPRAVGLPFSSAALQRAAWHALSRIRHRQTAIAEIAYLASQIDALGYASDRERRFLDEMKLPWSIAAQARLALGPGAPLLDARCLRWVATELCVAAVQPGPVRPPELDEEARQVQSLFFPLLGRSGVPFRKEMYRALWCLHEGFSLGSVGADEDEEPGLAALAMSAAHSIGARLFGEPDAHLFRAAEMWAIADDDPGVVDRDISPGAVRDEFLRVTGLRIPEFLALALLSAYAVRASHQGRDDLHETFRSLKHRLVPGKDAEFVGVVGEQMAVTPAELGSLTLQEMERYGIAYTGWGSVPQHASEVVRDRPVLRLDSVSFALGYGLFLDRAAELPAVVYQHARGWTDRRMKGQVGHLFEARLQHRIERLRPRCWVVTEDELEPVIDRGVQRPDAVIRAASGDTYLVVEINASKLETGVASGHRGSVSGRVDLYLRKRAQADALIADASAVIGRLLGVEHAIVGAAVPLLVTQEALPSNPALERALRERAPKLNPRFVCSVDEFELLLDLAEAGWDIAGMVRAWQERGGGQMLGTFVRTAAEITPRPDHLANRFVAALVADRDGQAA